MSPLAGTKHTYVRLAIIIYCQILTLFFQFVNSILCYHNYHNFQLSGLFSEQIIHV